MKKLGILMSAMVLSASASFGQTFQSGDKVASLGVGVGVVKNIPNPDQSATFTQKLSMEWCVKDGLFEKGSIGIGFAINNGYGGAYETEIAGKYDYSYTVEKYKHYKNDRNRWVTELYDVDVVKRKGYGTADADLNRNDLTAMFTASFHYQFLDKLDTYFTLGVGVTTIFHLTGNIHNENEFESKSDTPNFTNNKTDYDFKYSFNDLDHVKWQGLGTILRPAMAVHVGARYYFTENWAANMEVGLLNATFSDKYGSGYNVFSVGASYKF